MKSHKLFSIIILVWVYSEALYANSSNDNERLFDSMSPFEDLTEYALDQDISKITSSIGSMDGVIENVASLLPERDQNALRSALISMKHLNEEHNFSEIALLAVESYKMISDQLSASELNVPKEVVLLDYVGFKIHALLVQKEISWERIATTVEDAEYQWATIKSKVSDKALFDAMNTTIDGLKLSCKSKNIQMLNFAAQVDLDLVDLLEAHFE